MLHYQFVPIGATISILPELGQYKCVVLIERPVSDEFRNNVSQLLVESGCRYMMAWGLDCSAWDDSVDWANIFQFHPEKIPDDQFVMTTCHDGDSLEEVFRFAKFDAVSSGTFEPISNLLVLDFGIQERAAMLKDIYARSDNS